MSTLLLLLLIICGIAVILVGLFAVLMDDKFDKGNKTGRNSATQLQKRMDDKLNSWNEKQIATDLIRLQENQPMFRQYVQSLRKQFVDTQNTKIAQARNKFIQERIETLKLANQYRDLENELALKDQKYANELLELQLRHQQTKLSFENEEDEREIKRLETERRKIEKELEIAKLKREFEEINNPPPRPENLSPAEKRERKRAELKERIKTIHRTIEQIKNDPNLSEHDKQTQINQLERKKFDLNEELADLL
jgi:hypothetical protein